MISFLLVKMNSRRRNPNMDHVGIFLQRRTILRVTGRNGKTALGRSCGGSDKVVRFF